MTDNDMNIVIAPEMWRDMLTTANEIAALLAKLGRTHDMDVRVVLGVASAAAMIVGEFHKACDCDGCVSLVEAVAEEVYTRWDATASGLSGRVN
jgi:hypothetical protein